MAEQGARDCASRHHTTQEAGRDYCRWPSASATAATIAVARSARQISKQASRQIEQLASSDRRASMPRPLEAQCTVSSSCRCRRIPPNLGSAPFVPPPPAVILLLLPLNISVPPPLHSHPVGHLSISIAPAQENSQFACGGRPRTERNIARFRRRE